MNRSYSERPHERLAPSSIGSRKLLNSTDVLDTLAFDRQYPRPTVVNFGAASELHPNDVPAFRNASELRDLFDAFMRIIASHRTHPIVVLDACIAVLLWCHESTPSPMVRIARQATEPTPSGASCQPLACGCTNPTRGNGGRIRLSRPRR